MIIKFNHNFSDCLDEICICGKDIESSNHFLLQCSLFFNERQVLMNLTEMLILDLSVQKYALHTLGVPVIKLWRRLECLNIETIKVNRSSTKQLLNNFLWHFLEKLKQFSGRGSKMGCLYKKGVLVLHFAENYLFVVQDAAQGFNWSNSFKTVT